MNALRKIPLEGLIQILTNLFEDGADFIDISGVQDDREDGPVDVIKFEGDKAMVRFFNLHSSFLCYNLLNGKQYLGKPVDIIFIN